MRERLPVRRDRKAQIHDLQPDADQERQALLQGCGYRILRFPSDRVRRSLNQVIAEIDAALQEVPDTE